MRILGDMSVNINKNKLLDALHANRRKHEEDYKIALMNFRIEAINMLVDRKMELEEDGWKNIKPLDFLSFKLPVPENYTHIYTEVIDMLKMCEDTTIEVSWFQFQCWVKDEWEWKDSFKTSNSRYLGV